jgi:probable F420-dependent oxidoreductase
LKIGVKIGPALDRSVADAARRAEALGFDSVWVSERVAVPLDKPHPYDPMVDPWVALGFIAAVTERVELGTSVSQIALRPPVLMARELTTLDRLSEGRVIVGAGAGWVEEEFTSTDVEFATRGGRLNEFVPLLRHLWTRPEEAWNGKHFQVPAIGLVKPVTPGGPPIYLGAGGPPGLRRAARLGDGFIAVSVPPASLAALRERLLSMRAEFGREGPFPFYTQTGPPRSHEQARELVKTHAEAGVDGIILATAGSVSAIDFLDDEGVARELLTAAHAIGRSP